MMGPLLIGRPTMMKRMIAGLFIASLMTPLAGEAGLRDWFGSKEPASASNPVGTNTVKRLHLAISDKDAEKDLLQLFAVKRILAEERHVILLLVDEKRRDLDNLDRELLKTFGIQRDHRYQYDAKSMTITEFMDQSTNAAKTAKTPPRTLKSEKEARQFASLAAAKQTTFEDLTVLSRLAREKEVALNRVDTSLKDKFSMSRDRNYWYDPKTMRLYEVIAPSSKGTVQ